MLAIGCVGGSEIPPRQPRFEIRFTAGTTVSPDCIKRAKLHGRSHDCRAPRFVYSASKRRACRPKHLSSARASRMRALLFSSPHAFIVTSYNVHARLHQ